jgi:hypothetical protein
MSFPQRLSNKQSPVPVGLAKLKINKNEMEPFGVQCSINRSRDTRGVGEVLTHQAVHPTAQNASSKNIFFKPRGIFFLESGFCFVFLQIDFFATHAHGFGFVCNRISIRIVRTWRRHPRPAPLSLTPWHAWRWVPRSRRHRHLQRKQRRRGRNHQTRAVAWPGRRSCRR